MAMVSSILFTYVCQLQCLSITLLTNSSDNLNSVKCHLMKIVENDHNITSV